MREQWISIEDSMPDSNEEVLTYFHDEKFGIDQFNVFTYYKKGTIIDTKVARDCDSPIKNLFKTITGGEAIIAHEDGFYISEWDELGDSSYRKHADIITHWKRLKAPKDS